MFPRLWRVIAASSAAAARSAPPGSTAARARTAHTARLSGLCQSRAAARTLVTVEPQVTDTPEGRVLVIPPDAGYGAVVEPLSAVR